MAALTPEDAMRASACTDPQISPDGRLVAFVQTVANLSTNTNDAAIFISPLEGAEPPRRVAEGRSPRFSPDSAQVSFVQGGQLWLLDAAAPDAAPRQLSSFEGGLGGPLWADNSAAWSPDGRWIACISRGDSAARDYNPWGAMVPGVDDVLATERIFHKWEQGYNPALQLDGSYTACHVWVLPVGLPDGRAAMQLTHGDQDDHSISWCTTTDIIELRFGY